MTLLHSQNDGLFAQIIRRLILAVFLFAILDVMFVLATYLGNVQELGQRLLNRRAAEIVAAVHWDGSRLVYDDSVLTPESLDHPSFAFAIYDPEGHALTLHGPAHLTSHFIPPTTSVSEETRRDDDADGFHLHGIRRFSIEDHLVWVCLAIEGRGLQPFVPVILWEVVDHVALPLIPLSCLLLFFNIVSVRRTLRPLAKAIEQIHAINPRDISHRLEVPSSPLEVRHLVTAMNAALTRLESAIGSLRDFTADTAHELRTPLAIMMMEVDQLPACEGKEKLKTDLDGMTRLVGQMLDMAYADALIIPASSRADLSDVAASVITQLTPIALKMHKAILLQNAHPSEVNGHAEALGRALRNLIENALAHTPVHTNVEVSIGKDARIVVRDHGTGILESQRDASTRRFWRAERKETQGAGLGLAIATRIAHAHGGRIAIDSAADGGAIVSLILPESVS